MANNALLIGQETNSPDEGMPGEGLPDDAVLLCANYSIPCLWFLLFGSEHLAAREEEVIDEASIDDDECEDYEWITARVPVLIAPTNEALALAEARGDAIRRFLPEQFHKHFDEFVAFIGTVKEPYLRLDPSEVREMDDPEEFDAAFRSAVRAPETDDLDDWAALFEQGGMRLNRETRRAECSDEQYAPLFLRGYSEGRPVPWDE